jgi:trimeric autotransporter adhesin
MAIQIRGNQVLDNTLGAQQLNENDTYDFSSGVVSVATPSSAAHAATKAYVDSLIVDTFQGGDGIAIDDTTSPDTIAVDLATNPGLQFTSAKLDLKVKSEVGGSITKDADGIYIADSGIGNAKLAGSIPNDKLANSTISGKALGTSLDELTAGNGLTLTAYDGSAAQAIELALDAATLSKSAGGLKVADLGVDAGQLAAGAVETDKINDLAVTDAKIADSTITASKVAFASNVDKLVPDGSATAFDLSATIPSEFAAVMCFRNGMSLEQVATPANIDEFKIELAAGTAGVSLITFGAAIPSGENVRVFFIA